MKLMRFFIALLLSHQLWFYTQNNGSCVSIKDVFLSTVFLSYSDDE